MLPPLAFSVVVRGSVMSPLIARVPPLNESVAPAAPRLLFESIEIVPPLMAVLPV